MSLCKEAAVRRGQWEDGRDRAESSCNDISNRDPPPRGALPLKPFGPMEVQISEQN